jgi:hypothetical protein
MTTLAVRFYCCAPLMLIVLLGCSTGPSTGTVTGEVTLDDQPIKDGRLTFIPVDGQGPTGGALIKDGKFVASGVPATKMKVQINGNRVKGKYKAFDTPESPWIDDVEEMVPQKFNFNSELTLDVKPGDQDVKYHLKSK